MSRSTPPDTPSHWLSTLGDAQPLHSTLPTPGAPNELAKVELVANKLGTPLLPWQRYFIRVATELKPDGSYRYPTVVLTVPRQSGKTTVVRALLATRALLNKNRRAYLTCQTGKDARERLFELSDQLAVSVLGKTIKVRRAADQPRITFHTGSRINAFSPTPESVHGANFADGLIDECFAFDDAQGSDILAAMVPAMQTHKDRQLIMVSTKGTPASTFLNGWIAKGREAVKEADSPIAYFEWSLADGLDPMDPENWGFHPGLQGELITKDDIRAAAKVMSRGEFTRAYMNRQTATAESVFDMDRWDALKGTLSVPARSRVAIGWEIAQDRSRAAICAAWREGETVHVRIIRNGPGSDWVQPTLEALAKAQPLAIAADRYPENSVVQDRLFLANPHFPAVLLKAESFKTACASFRVLLADKLLVHDGHLGLRAAVATAVSRPIGETVAISHKSQPELLAMISACRMLDETREKQKPFIMVGD